MPAFLTGYWRAEGAIGADPATRALLAALPSGGAVVLLPVQRYREVPVADAWAGRPESGAL